MSDKERLYTLQAKIAPDSQAAKNIDKYCKERGVSKKYLLMKMCEFLPHYIDTICPTFEPVRARNPLGNEVR